jgi:quercetin dioxygenase-like cupin family protein
MPGRVFCFFTRGNSIGEMIPLQGVENMVKISLSQNDLSYSVNRLIHQSRDKKVRLYEIIFQKGQGIGPHIHPTGEDCAVVLFGTLTYWISNREAVEVEQGGAVFGWQNCIHGYLNNSDLPLQLLVFVAPHSIGLDYPADDDPRVIHLPIEKRVTQGFIGKRFSSPYSRFEIIEVTGRYADPSDHQFQVFVDVLRRDLYIFDHEPAVLSFSGPTRLIRYIA